MKKLKKLLAIMLSTVMLFSVAVNVFAEEEKIVSKVYYVKDVDLQFKMYSNYNTLETYTAMAVEKGFTEEEAAILFADFYERFCNSPRRSSGGFRYNPLMSISVINGYVPTVEDFEEFGAILITPQDTVRTDGSSGYWIGFADAKVAFDNLENIRSMANITGLNLQHSVNAILIAQVIDTACLEEYQAEETVQRQRYFVTDVDVQFEWYSDYNTLEKYTAMAVEKGYTEEEAAILFADFYERFCNSPFLSANKFWYDPLMFVYTKNGYVPALEDFEQYGAIEIIHAPAADPNLPRYVISFADAKDAVDNLDTILSNENIERGYVQRQQNMLMIANYIDTACLNRPCYADLDGDKVAGKVADVVLLSKYIKGTIQLSDETKVAADLNLDGAIDTEDLQIIINYLTNEITVLPYSLF
ncbi:MAG: dockerin type I repeat-containing protein [Oscillospiraceae bacterium]|jgi:hypothetical protein|nr:dockerin type I repeat-containing protein [Oscillospiraceae bacterium]